VNEKEECEVSALASSTFAEERVLGLGNVSLQADGSHRSLEPELEEARKKCVTPSRADVPLKKRGYS